MLRGKTVFITGASRGIGLAIAKRLAREGANVAVAAKTTEPHPKLPGTIFTAAEEIEAAGGRALPLAVDVRDEVAVQEAMARTVETFGGLDVLINNASAIQLTGTVETAMKRFDLMFDVNVRGTFLCSQTAIPHLAKSANPHILMLSPPLSMEARWFAGHVAYTMSKYGMSQCVLGMSAELAPRGIAVNALWPRTVIDTAALAMLGGLVPREGCRTPEIVADAAAWILAQPSRTTTGNFFLDEEVLRAQGETDFARYSVVPGAALLPDLFLD
jgi:citronellol/citronellal dehydrogenase